MDLNTSISFDIEKYWHWWINELRALIPDSVRGLLTQKSEFLVISENDGLFSFDHCVDGALESLGSVSVDVDSSHVNDQMFRERPELKDVDIIYNVPSVQGLLKAFKLPAVAQENLQNVVSFEMDRHTPFSAEQVYYDTRVADTLTESNQIKVELALVSRSKLDETLRILSGWGLTPNIVDMATNGEKQGIYTPKFNLLPQHLRSNKRDLPKILNTIFSIVLTMLILGILVLPIWIKKSYLSDLKSEVSRVSKVATEVQSLKKEADDGMRELNFLLEKKHLEPVVVEMMEELTKLIPDDAWLTNLQLKQRRLQIQGQSPAASKLIEAIESSAMFNSTRFVSPVTQDRRTGLERFQIATNVVNRRKGEKAVDSES